MKKILYAAVGILLVVIIIAGIWAAPFFKAASLLNKAPDLNRFSFSAEINLGSEAIDSEQQKFLSSMAWLLGVEESDMLTFKAEGRYYDDNIYALIYCGNLPEPVTDIYLADGETYLNIRMLYDTIHEKISETHPLLSKLIPAWGYNDYITLGQVEQIFNADIRGMFYLEYPRINGQKNYAEYFAMLLGMEHSRGENGELVFGLPLDEYDISFQISEESDITCVAAEGISEDGGQPVESFNAEVLFNGPEKVSAPDSIMEQDAVDGFAGLWSVISSLTD